MTIIHQRIVNSLEKLKIFDRNEKITGNYYYPIAYYYLNKDPNNIRFTSAILINKQIVDFKFKSWKDVFEKACKCHVKLINHNYPSSISLVRYNYSEKLIIDTDALISPTSKDEISCAKQEICYYLNFMNEYECNPSIRITTDSPREIKFNEEDYLHPSIKMPWYKIF